jgi:hypothetical protein
MYWRCGSSSRVPALQVQNPEFKPQSHQKQKKGSVKDHSRSAILGCLYTQPTEMNMRGVLLDKINPW